MGHLIGDAVMSWLHFVLVFAIVAALSGELVLVRTGMSVEAMRRVSRLDLVYGLSALGLLIVGFGRAAHFAKGWAYYSSQPWFWVKVGAFAAVGLVSIPPTIQFARWRKALKSEAAPHCDDATARRMRRLIHIELTLLLVIVAAAALMARGLGAAA